MKISVVRASNSYERLDDHLVFIVEKYDIVGRLLKAGEKPSVYPVDEPTADGVAGKKND